MTDPAELHVASVEFEQFYRDEYPGLFAVATALSGRDGEDLVHDAMVTTFASWRRVRNLERPGGWCHHVLVNRCRSWWRRRQTELRHAARQRRTETPSTYGSTELSAEVAEFWAAVRSLPERPRHVVTLYYAADRSTADIARILDLAEGTVRSDLARARQALARELGT